MPTSKKTGTKASASSKATATDLKSTTKAVQDAVARALKAKEVQPKIRGPIFVGIIYNPISKQFEAINQFE